MSDNIAVRTRSVSKRYTMGSAEVRALDGVSIEIGQGEFVALLGTSGSGKSTLMNLIAGLDRPSSGSIEVFGKDLAALSRRDLSRYRRDSVGMVFQSFNLIPTMTLEENVELPMRFAEVEGSERDQRVREALQRVRLGERMTHRPSELSGGEQQRGALARALVSRPKLLLADEPTGNLDSKTGTEIMNMIREFNQNLGMTVIMVTHDRPLAERYASRIIFLADGKQVGDQVVTPQAEEVRP